MSDKWEDARQELRDMYCANCREYKGMETDSDTGERYCIFCK